MTYETPWIDTWQVRGDFMGRTWDDKHALGRSATFR